MDAKALEKAGARGRYWLDAESRARVRLDGGIAVAQTKGRRLARKRLVERAVSDPIPVMMNESARNDRYFRLNWRKKKRIPGYYDVGMHGAPGITEMYGVKVDYETIWDVVRGRADYTGEDIRLLSCNAGVANEKGFCVAQALADYSGKKVMAPTGLLYLHPDGSITINVRSDGSMATFEPRRRTDDT